MPHENVVARAVYAFVLLSFADPFACGYRCGAGCIAALTTTGNLANKTVDVQKALDSVTPTVCSDAPLQFLNQSLHLFSFFSSHDHALLRHFLRHYIALGVPAASGRIHLVTHVAPANRVGAAPVRSVLNELGVPRGALHVYEGNYSDVVKIETANAFIDTLPRDAWLIREATPPGHSRNTSTRGHVAHPSHS